jgi:hypothetical protein
MSHDSSILLTLPDPGTTGRRLTLENFAPSSGICLMMSAELKIGSRYSHVAWHVSHWSNMSCVCKCCMFKQSHRHAIGIE